MVNCPSSFISSTYADLKRTRQLVYEAVLQCECLPIGMEYFPVSESPQFEYIKKSIDLCDCFILIIAESYGTVAHDGKSYTEKEFDYAIRNHKPVLAFIREPKETLSDDRLEAFRNKVMENRLVKFWKTEQELKGYVIQGVMSWKSSLKISCENRLIDVVGWKPAEEVAKYVRLDLVVNVQLEELCDYTADHSDWAPNFYFRSMSFWEIYAVLKPFLIKPKTDDEVNNYLSGYICENEEDGMGYGNERVISGDLMRIKLVLVAHHLIVIDSYYRWKIEENL